MGNCVIDNRRLRLFENGNITITSYARTYPEDKDCYFTDQIEKKVEAGKTAKTFYINNRHYRSVSSSSVKLWQKRKNAIIFVTLTFPEFIQEIDANICFSKFVENLKVNYQLNHYLAIKELTEAGRPHFHCLFDLPFTDVYKLNKAWTMTYREFMPYSANALRLGSPKHGTVVKNINQCVKYLCKYMSKIKDSDKNRYKARCIFMSRSIRSRPVDIQEADLRRIIELYKWRAIKYEYCTIILLKNIFSNLPYLLSYFDEISQKTVSFEHNFP